MNTKNIYQAEECDLSAVPAKDAKYFSGIDTVPEDKHVVTVYNSRLIEQTTHWLVLLLFVAFIIISAMCLKLNNENKQLTLKIKNNEQIAP